MAGQKSRMRRLAFLLVLLTAAPPVASGASSPWYDSEGASLRLVTAGGPDESGILRGALQVKLKPGWNTYWRDPGDSGVPPRVTIEGNGASLAAIAFPAPRRHDAPGGSWTGYDRPVDFALFIKLAPEEPSGPVAADIFLGVCRDICIPLQVRLSLDPRAGAARQDDAAIVAAAHAATPAPARPGFRVTGATLAGKALRIRAELPDPAGSAELFVVPPPGYGLAPATWQPDGDATFSIALRERPPGKPGGATLSYTLVQGMAAVEGTIDLRWLPRPP